MPTYRPGFHKIPRQIYQAENLSVEERFLVMYFNSHSPTRVHHKDFVLKNLGWGKNKYDNVRKTLVDKGILQTNKVREIDRSTRKYTVVGFRAYVDLTFLTPQTNDLEGPSKPPKSASSKRGRIRTSTNKGRFDPEVIDDGDAS